MTGRNCSSATSGKCSSAVQTRSLSRSKGIQQILGSSTTARQSPSLTAEQKTYATEKVAGTIDAMLDELHDKYDTAQPLADFLFADPYKVFTEGMQSGTYVGLDHVGQVMCHHLAFRQRTMDWQIWIDAGEQPLPHKFLITYKRQAGQPQYIALIQHWEVNPKLADELFQFQPPEGIRKVDFLNRRGKQ